MVGSVWNRSCSVQELQNFKDEICKLTCQLKDLHHMCFGSAFNCGLTLPMSGWSCTLISHCPGKVPVPNRNMTSIPTLTVYILLLDLQFTQDHSALLKQLLLRLGVRNSSHPAIVLWWRWPEKTLHACVRLVANPKPKYGTKPQTKISPVQWSSRAPRSHNVTPHMDKLKASSCKQKCLLTYSSIFLWGQKTASSHKSCCAVYDPWIVLVAIYIVHSEKQETLIAMNTFRVHNAACEEKLFPAAFRGTKLTEKFLRQQNIQI